MNCVQTTRACICIQTISYIDDMAHGHYYLTVLTINNTKKLVTYIVLQNTKYFPMVPFSRSDMKVETIWRSCGYTFIN